MFRDKVHSARGGIGRYQLGHWLRSIPAVHDLQLRKLIRADNIPELAMQKAMHDPMNQHQTAVAGPPELIGLRKVAGTDPRTPRIEMAYDTVDHFVNSRRSSCGTSTSEILSPWSTQGTQATGTRTCLYPIRASIRSSSFWMVAITAGRWRLVFSDPLRSALDKGGFSDVEA